MTSILLPSTPVGRLGEAWRHCVGFGNWELALHHEHHVALEMVQERIGFRHVRGHGLISDGMAFARNHLEGNAVDGGLYLNFTYIDRAIDAFRSLGVKPFIELAFMPECLASGTKTVFTWKGNITPPADHARWAAAIEGLLRHLLDRYGDEALSWPVEVWNEPDLPFFWSADQAAYFELYRHTALAVKRVHPGFQVGGPATCPGAIGWITPFVEFCRTQGVPVDFIATHSYTSGPQYVQREFVHHHRWLPLDHNLNQFRCARDLTRASSRPELPVYITEFNTSYNPRSIIHDTALNAAWVAHTLAHGGDIVDSFSYWTFSDVFDEADTPRSLFHGGFGLVAHGNIPKPSFHAFAFMARMGQELLHRSDRQLITRDRDGAITILAWNPVLTALDTAERVIDIDLPHDGPWAIEERCVDEEQGNAWQAWRCLGHPRHVSAAQTAQLREAGEPSCRWRRQHDRRLRLHLGRNAVTFLRCAPAPERRAELDGFAPEAYPSYGGSWDGTFTA